MLALDFNYIPSQELKEITEKAFYKELTARRADIIGAIDVVDYGGHKNQLKSILNSIRDSLTDYEYYTQGELTILTAYVNEYEYKLLKQAYYEITGQKAPVYVIYL